jgi:hypothetical protein
MKFDKENIITNRLTIGKRMYRVIDNSYQNCLSDGRNYHLAGMFGQEGQIVEIVKLPYAKDVSFMSHNYVKYFIVAKCSNGLLHEMLYYPHGLVRNY